MNAQAVFKPFYFSGIIAQFFNFLYFTSSVRLVLVLASSETRPSERYYSLYFRKSYQNMSYLINWVTVSEWQPCYCVNISNQAYLSLEMWDD